MATKNIKVVDEPGDGPYMEAYIDELPDGSGSYVLPAATTSTLGGVKMAAHVDGSDGTAIVAALVAAGIMAAE